MTAGPQRGARCWSGGSGFAQSRRGAGGRCLIADQGFIAAGGKETASADPGPSHASLTRHLDQAPSTRFPSLASGRVCVAAVRQGSCGRSTASDWPPRTPGRQAPWTPHTSSPPQAALTGSPHRAHAGGLLTGKSAPPGRRATKAWWPGLLRALLPTPASASCIPKTQTTNLGRMRHQMGWNTEVGNRCRARLNTAGVPSRCTMAMDPTCSIAMLLSLALL